MSLQPKVEYVGSSSYFPAVFGAVAFGVIYSQKLTMGFPAAGAVGSSVCVEYSIAQAIHVLLVVRGDSGFVCFIPSCLASFAFVATYLVFSGFPLPTFSA